MSMARGEIATIIKDSLTINACCDNLAKKVNGLVASLRTTHKYTIRINKEEPICSAEFSSIEDAKVCAEACIDSMIQALGPPGCELDPVYTADIYSGAPREDAPDKPMLVMKFKCVRCSGGYDLVAVD